MAHALVFHSAADSDSVRSMLVGLTDMRVLPVRGPVPAGVQFGGRVVAVWSQHAAAEYNPANAPQLPRNSIVVCLDDTPLPPSMAALPLALHAQGDGADQVRLKAALTTVSAPVARRPVAARPRPSLERPLRPAPSLRAGDAGETSPARAKAVARRQTQSASVVVSASAFGTLTAVALGSVFPADTIVTPSFAATPDTESTVEYARLQQLEAQSRHIAASAGFEGVMTPAGASVAFTAEEIETLTDRLAATEQQLNAARDWSDGFINRLQGLSAQAPEAMPAMGAVPRGPSTSASAPAGPEGQSLAEAAPEQAPLALRERFTQVEPMAYAVDRIADIAAAPAPVPRDAGA